METVFSIAICRPTGDKWQSKTLFLSIFDPRSSIVDCVFDYRLPSAKYVKLSSSSVTRLWQPHNVGVGGCIVTSYLGHFVVSNLCVDKPFYDDINKIRVYCLRQKIQPKSLNSIYEATMV